MSKMSNADVIVYSDIKRYKKNSRAANFVYLALCFLILYFLILYANRVGNREAVFEDSVLGSKNVYSYIFGVDVILNLLVLLFGFYTGVKLGGYSKSFSYVAFVLAAVEIGRIFLIPFCYVNVSASTGTMLETYDFVWLVVMLAASAAFLVLAGVLGLLGAMQREKFQSELDSGAIDLEEALKDENDVLSKDESSLDIFEEDLDGKKSADADETEEVIEEGAVNLGGDV